MNCSHERFTCWKVEELSKEEAFGSENYLSSMEWLNNDFRRVSVIEICVGKLEKLKPSLPICYEVQTFPTWVPQLEKRKHKIVCERHIVIYLNVSTTVAFRNSFPRQIFSVHELFWSVRAFFPPIHQKHFLSFLSLLGKKQPCFVKEQGTEKEIRRS